MDYAVEAHRVHFVNSEGNDRYAVALEIQLLGEIMEIKRAGGVIVSVGEYNFSSGKTTFERNNKVNAE